MHDQKINYDGALRDKYGEVVFKNGAPVPDPNSPYRTKDGKPTVAAQPVSLAQKNDIDRSYQEKAKTHVTIDDIKAQAGDRERKDRKEDAGDIAWNLYESGQINKMNGDQRAIVMGSKRKDLQAANLRFTAATNAYDKATSSVLLSDEDKAKLPQTQMLKDAQDQFNETLSEYRELAGNPQGKQFGQKVAQQYGTPDVPTWPAANKKIEDSNLPDSDKEAAKTSLYNSLSPSQQEEAKTQAAANAAAAKEGKPAPFPAAGTPAVPTTSPTAAPAGAGTTNIMGPDHLVHAIPNDQVPAALAAGGQKVQ
jgi:hypothetical protein